MRFSSGVRISAFFYVLGLQVFGVVRGAGGIPLVGDGGRDLQGVALAEMGCDGVRNAPGVNLAAFTL